MGSHSFSILAADDDTLKVIGTIVFLIIWGISAMASATKKAKEAARRKQLQAGTARPPEMFVQPPIRVTPAPLPPLRPAASRPAARRPAPPPPPKLQRPAAKPRVLVAPPLPTFAPPTITVAQGATPAAPSQRPEPIRASPVRSPIVNGWLNASTVRSQFILAEAFKPPLALRERRSP